MEFSKEVHSFKILDEGKYPVKRNPEWIPSFSEVVSWSEQAIRSFRLNRIDYGSMNSIIFSVTFVFTDGTMVPPSGTYPRAPNLQLPIPLNEHVAKINFGQDEFSNICMIKLFTIEGNVVAVIDVH